MNDFLQISLILATLTLLGTCLTLHRVPWYVLYSLYGLSFSCLAGFGSARYAPALFGWFASGIAIMLAFCGGIVTWENYRRPMTAADRTVINQRIVYWIAPVLAVILSLWYFDKRTATIVQQAVDNVNAKVDTVIQANQVIVSKINQIDQTVKADSATVKARMDTMADLQNQLWDKTQRVQETSTDNNLLLHKVQLEQQKQKRR